MATLPLLPQASLSCSISPDATISNVGALGGSEGKEVRELAGRRVGHTPDGAGSVVVHAVVLSLGAVSTHAGAI
jgi:hypothetical protein